MTHNIKGGVLVDEFYTSGSSPPTNAHVNIGTTTQAFNLAIVDSAFGNMLMQSTTATLASFIRFRDEAGVNKASFGYGNSAIGGIFQDTLFINGSVAGVDVEISTNATERMRFTSSGLIGVNTAGIGGPSADFHLNALTSVNLLITNTVIAGATGADVQVTPGTANNIGINANVDGDSGISYGVKSQAASTAENRAIYGNALLGTTNWAGYFDSGNVNINNTLFLPALTAGAVTFIQSDNSLSQDTANLFWDFSGLNLGIRTSTPGAALDIASGNLRLATTGTLQFGSLSVLSYSGSDLHINNVSTNNIIFDLSGTEQMRLDTSGNLGIGGSPTSRLHVFGAAHITGKLTVDGAIDPTSITCIPLMSTNSFIGRDSANTTDVFTVSDTGVLTAVSISGALTPTGQTLFPNGTAGAPSVSWINDTDTGLYLSVPGQPFMSVDGISVMVWAQDQVQIYGTTGLLMLGSGATIKNQSGSASLPSYTFFNDSDTGMLNPIAGQIAFSTNGNQRLTIDSTGNVYPQTAFAQSLGSSTAQWYRVHCDFATSTSGSEIGVNGRLEWSSTSDPTASKDVGIVRDAAGRIRVSGGGGVGTEDIAADRFLAQNGSNSLPSFSFSGDDDNGMLLSGTNAVRFVTGGTDRLTIASDGSITINEGGISTGNLRVEGDTNSTLLFTDAATDRVGIGIGTPNSTLHVNGSTTFSTRTNTATTDTITATDNTVFENSAAAAITVTLPAASASTIGRIYRIYQTGGNTVTVQRAGADTINAGTSFSIGGIYKMLLVVGHTATSWIASTISGV